MSESLFPLLLLHGALGNKLQFDPLLKLFSSDATVHSLDFSGHGENSGDDDNFSLQLFTDDVIHYLDALAIEKADIFGHSMGGYVGINLCLHHPERVNKVFTLGSKLNWSSESALKETGMLDAEKLLAKVPAFVEDLKKRHPAADWKMLLEKTKNMMLELGETNPLNPQALSSIVHQIRLGIGDRDTTAGLEDTLAAYRSLPNAQLQVFPATLHAYERISQMILKGSMEEFFRD